MKKTQVELDNRIFALQNKELPQVVADLVCRADVAYLQDRDEEAERLIGEAEKLYIEVEKIKDAFCNKLETISKEDVDDLLAAIDDFMDNN